MDTPETTEAVEPVEAPETTTIYIIESAHGTVHISVGATLRDAIPVGKDHELDNRLLPALQDADGIRWRRVGTAGGEGDAGGRAALAADTGDETPAFDPAPIVAMNATDAIAALATLTPDQLLSLRDAEAKEGGTNRKTVLAAIDKAIAAAN